MVFLFRRAVLIVALLVFRLLYPLPAMAESDPAEQGSDGNGQTGGFSLRVENGLLSVSIQEIRLERVLQAVAEKAGLQVALSGPAEERISIEFTRMPVDHGLKRILKGRGFLLIYGQKGLRAVEVYSRKNLGIDLDRRPQRLLLPEAEPEFQQLARRALEAHDPDERLEAVEDLGLEIDEQRAAEILIQVLESEKNGEIRMEALEALGDFENKGGLPLKALMISINDPLREVRMQAVEILEDLEATDELKWVAQSHNDPARFQDLPDRARLPE